MATVTGRVKDPSGTSMGNRTAEVVFEIEEELVLAAGGTMIPNEPVRVQTDADGTFAVQLQPSLETNPYIPYRVSIYWASGGQTLRAKPRKFHIVVPADGGDIDDMIAVVLPSRIITKGDPGSGPGGGGTVTLPAAVVLAWKPNTYYAAGAVVISPKGDAVKAKANHTSSGSYVAASWTGSALEARVRQLELTGGGSGGSTTVIEGGAGADAVRRPMIGARVGAGSANTIPDSQYFDETHLLETAMSAPLDVVNWYRSIGPTSAEEFTATVKPELEAYPNRKVLYVFEIHKSNSQFNKEFDAQNGIYPDLVETLMAIKNSGHADRVFIAPFHEGNGGGGAPGDIGSYPWHAYDTDQEMFNGTMTRVNTAAKYKEAFRNVATLIRDLGLPSKIVQWYLAANTSDATLVDGVERMDMANIYAGDEYVDIIGLSYYNRSGDTRYSNTWPEPGSNGLREFYNAFERMTGRPLWLCETGCAQSNEYGDKGEWYADLVKLVASAELPRIEGMVMFMQDTRKYDTNGVVTQGMDMKLENTAQKKLLGRAINAARRPAKVNAIPPISRNLLPISATDLTTTDGWEFSGGVGLSVSNANTPDMDAMANGLRVTKPAYVTGDDLTSHNIYRRVSKANLDYVPNDPYVFSFWARASYDGFRIEAGIRQDGIPGGGGTATSLGDELVLSNVWEQYVVAFSSQTDDDLVTSWRIPNFNFGNNKNTVSAWFEVAGLRLSRGSEAQPNVERLLRPKVKAVTNAANLTWNCEAGQIFTVTIGQNVTLMAPTGVAHDGQEATFRIKQDATGGRTINLHADFYSSTAVVNQTTLPGSITVMKFQYDAAGARWGMTSSALWGLT